MSQTFMDGAAGSNSGSGNYAGSDLTACAFSAQHFAYFKRAHSTLARACLIGNVAHSTEMDRGEPDPMPSGSRPPPRPPKLTAIGFDDQNDKRRFSVARAADGEGKYIRSAQYGHVIVRLEPSGRGKGVIILNDLTNGAFPDRFIKSVSEGFVNP